MEFYSVRGKIGQSFGGSHCSGVGGGGDSCKFACCFDVSVRMYAHVLWNCLAGVVALPPLWHAVCNNLRCLLITVVLLRKRNYSNTCYFVSHLR